MDPISAAISAFVVGGFVGGWLVSHEQRRQRSAELTREWEQEEQELAEINATRRRFGRETLQATEWREMRRRAMERAIPNALDAARSAAVYNPTRDGERWKDSAPIWQCIQHGREPES